VLGICRVRGDGVCEWSFCVGGDLAACERSLFGVISFSLEILILNEGGIVIYPIKRSKKQRDFKFFCFFQEKSSPPSLG
jgi:hypothetical protein